MRGGASLEKYLADDACAMTLSLLAKRAEDATLCPSEVARALATANGTENWRDAMTAVHAATALLAADGQVRLTWKGVLRKEGNGPYRIGHVET